MTKLAEISTAAHTEDFMRGVGLKGGISLTLTAEGGFYASTHWPNGDCIRDQHCFGTGKTISAAIAAMLSEIEMIKSAPPAVTTAEECKRLVISLIDKHDAAPPEFRDAVAAIKTKGR